MTDNKNKKSKKCNINNEENNFYEHIFSKIDSFNKSINCVPQNNQRNTSKSNKNNDKYNTKKRNTCQNDKSTFHISNKKVSPKDIKCNKCNKCNKCDKCPNRDSNRDPNFPQCNINQRVMRSVKLFLAKHNFDAICLAQMGIVTDAQKINFLIQFFKVMQSVTNTFGQSTLGTGSGTTDTVMLTQGYSDYGFSNVTMNTTTNSFYTNVFLLQTLTSPFGTMTYIKLNDNSYDGSGGLLTTASFSASSLVNSQDFNTTALNITGASSLNQLSISYDRSILHPNIGTNNVDIRVFTRTNNADNYVYTNLGVNFPITIKTDSFLSTNIVPLDSSASIIQIAIVMCIPITPGGSAAITGAISLALTFSTSA